ncbi:TIGR03084 family metal-binding protein [Blastococcus haudaquaticus]|uniref:TIGR03084 family protein n=1 Tax=Blastococcus haudaquaticus TaxID=1938745 RepID=A0A286GGD4_9ACTN|nr:TIGR03084 family metal-binding protein [Blastococcus haudaquaticus]SOD94581.1 TIGR03084 family protein [Blastococcus haudaquaticus]
MSDRARLLAALLDDLAAESAQLDTVVTQLEDIAWLAPTPAAGWTVAMQIAHLAWTDEQALLAVTDPTAFTAAVAASGPDLAGAVDAAAAAGAAGEPAPLLARWRTGRAALARELAALPDGATVPWFGPPMGAASLATARLMETWAHGLDVTDALRLPPSVSLRLRAVAHLGVRTRDFAFAQHGLPAPAEPFRVELTAPDGAVWTFGPEDAAQRVTGPALDFCLRVTRRRHRADLHLTVTGPDADRWLDLAQAFAGPPGADRPPAQEETP